MRRAIAAGSSPSQLRASSISASYCSQRALIQVSEPIRKRSGDSVHRARQAGVRRPSSCQAGAVRQLSHQRRMALHELAHARRRRAADAGVGPDQPGTGRVAHQPLDGRVVHMRQHGEPALARQLHQLDGHRAIGVGAVVEVEFTQAAVGPGRRAGSQLRQHHLVDRLVGEPAAVVGPVAVQAHERHHADAGRARRCRRRGQRRVPSLGRLLATMARTPLRCMRPSTSASGCGPAASSL